MGEKDKIVWWATAKGRLEAKLCSRHSKGLDVDTEGVYRELNNPNFLRSLSSEEVVAASELRKKYEDVLIRERLKKHLDIE